MSCSRVRRDTLQIQVHCSGIQRDTPQTQCFVCFTVPHLLLYVLSRFFFFLLLNIEIGDEKIYWRVGVIKIMIKCREEKELATDKKSVKSPTTDFFTPYGAKMTFH